MFDFLQNLLEWQHWVMRVLQTGILSVQYILSAVQLRLQSVHIVDNLLGVLARIQLDQRQLSGTLLKPLSNRLLLYQKHGVRPVPAFLQQLLSRHVEPEQLEVQQQLRFRLQLLQQLLRTEPHHEHLQSYAVQQLRNLY